MDGTDRNVSSIDNEAVGNEKMSLSSSDLSQTLLSINSSLGCMSDILMKLVAGSEHTTSFAHTQSTTGALRRSMCNTRLALVFQDENITEVTTNKTQTKQAPSYSPLTSINATPISFIASTLGVSLISKKT